MVLTEKNLPRRLYKDQSFDTVSKPYIYMGEISNPNRYDMGLVHSLFFQQSLQSCDVMHLESYYIFEQLPLAATRCRLKLEPSVGYHLIRLDPQGPKMGWEPRISGPDQLGRLRQVPGGPELGHPQELIF